MIAPSADGAVNHLVFHFVGTEIIDEIELGRCSGLHAYFRAVEVERGLLVHGPANEKSLAVVVIGCCKAQPANVCVCVRERERFFFCRAMNKETALDLDGAKVCVQTGTTTELNLVDYFRANKMKYEVIAAPSAEAAIKDYDSGTCNVFSADVSQLFAIRLLLSKPDDHVILPDVISKEPLGPVVRQDDLQWFNIVKWVQFAMVNAEELGVTSQNIGEALNSAKPDVKRLLGVEGNTARGWDLQRIGRPASSGLSAITAKFTSGLSVSGPRWVSRAESISCGAKAAFSTRRQFADQR